MPRCGFCVTASAARRAQPGPWGMPTRSWPRLATTAASAASPAAAFGRCLAAFYIARGLEDGSNERHDYATRFYKPVNPALVPSIPGNITLNDPNRWQPLDLPRYIDQSGHTVDGAAEFISPEWGWVTPFALSEEDLTVHRRDGAEFHVYHDPGPPPTFDGPLSGHYEWGFGLVARWSAHLSPDDGVLIDIAPSGMGNAGPLPRRFENYPGFYDPVPWGPGYRVNPVTGKPYAPQLVPRGDYTRVLAEYWADGPDSETPPGHWFTILNAVSDHELLARRLGGKGPVLDRLEWDVKAYFALGGAMHDAAVAAWGIKGWYDYIRPVSATPGHGRPQPAGRPGSIADGRQGASRWRRGLSNASVPATRWPGGNGEHVGKVKLLAWRGPGHVDRQAAGMAGVGWIRAEDWWPYQRPTFVTPPFAGYVSGHSTFSRAAAEVLTAFTGDPFFPGGMSDFPVPADTFLVFESGPSVDMALQWATYRDAADQCSLSRIWGGIHPPADDIPGRLIGEQDRTRRLPARPVPLRRRRPRLAASSGQEGPGRRHRPWSATIGSRRAAWLAGWNPNTMPIAEDTQSPLTVASMETKKSHSVKRQITHVPTAPNRTPSMPPAADRMIGLRQELVPDVAAARAERAANPDLLPPLRHRDQHDVHHPDAADDERNAAGRGEQQGHDAHLRLLLLDKLGRARDRELQLLPPGAEPFLHVARGERMVDVGRRAGDDRVDSRASGLIRRAVEIGMNRELFAFTSMGSAWFSVCLPEHAGHGEQSAHRGDGLADDALGAGAAHGVCDIRAHHAEISVAIEMGDEPSLRQFQPVEARKGPCHAMNDPPAQVLSGIVKPVVQLDSGRRLQNRRDGVRKEQRVGEEDAPSLARRLRRPHWRW